MKSIRHGALSMLSAAVLAACNNGSSDTDTAPGADAPAPAPAAQLVGTVGVGAPMTGGTLRVIDATGAEVASGIVVADDGSYLIPAFAGTPPYRIEACGYAGPNYECIYSVTQGSGRANVTPLTTATVLLASGQTPEALMAGPSSVLTDGAIEGAQNQLRTSLAGVMSGNVSPSFDFVGGDLSAGSRTGYDRLLDVIGVSIGVDDHPFVQISPRQGTGNLFLEQGNSTGTLTPDAAASTLSLTGLEQLFANMTAAIASESACTHPVSGLQPLLSSNAKLSMDDGEPLAGPAAVAAGLCQFLGHGEGNSGEAMWGSRFLSPTLGRCDFTGAYPICRVSFVLQDTSGGVKPVGSGMAVSFESGLWKFMGDASPVNIHANARVQRDRRIDGGQNLDSYSRALAFDIPALTGLQCAKVAQRDAAGALVTIAYYKRHVGEGQIRRLSAWRDNNSGDSRSIDPLQGSTRSSDDTWLMLPGGVDGDAVVRNFFRGGRTVAIFLYSDDACSTPIQFGGMSEFEVDVEGVPPLWSAMASLPWPDLTSATRTHLATFAMDASSTADLTIGWSFSGGALGINGLVFCMDRATCGQDEPGRIGERDVSASATSGAMTLHTSASALMANGYKLIALYGGTGDGMGVQSNFVMCPTITPGEECR